jgi:dual specificity phosphatase 12
MKEVREKLFIGNIVDAGQVKFAKGPPVTHLLSLVAASGSFLESQKPAELPPAAEKLVRMVVPLLDVAYQNILDELEPCLEFIEQGRSAGGVLVHCLAGISRRYHQNIILAFRF